jgi:Tfp pilus assembly protein PilV
VEIVVTAAVLLIIAAGVLSMLDNANARGGEQRARAVAGNLAQNEQERLRALPLDELSNNHSVSTQTVNGARFDLESRAAWVTDAAGDASCATGGASADYIRITTTVATSSLRGRAPVRLDSIIAPPARAFGASEGSLAVQVLDGAGAPVPGLAMSLSGLRNVSGVTNAEGCVIWGYLPAANDYQLTFAQAGWIDPSGVTAVATQQAVVGEQTRNVIFNYDRGGVLRASFATTPASGGAARATDPGVATVENPGPPSTFVSYPLTAGQLVTPLLFPFSSDWAVFADDCAAAKPPEASGLVLGKVTPETITNTDQAVIPSLDYLVVNGTGTTPPAVSGATVVVVTSCGTKYTRTTGADGRLTDPGFPWGTGFSVCVSSGTGTTARKRTYTAVANTTLPGQDIAVNLNGLPATSTPCV